jgi:hypothetical protein
MNPAKYTKEYKNAALTKWRREHPERAKELAQQSRKRFLEKHPNYAEEYSQKWKREHPEQRKAVDDARNNSYKLKGICTQCGSTEHIERHHPDYSKPLEFIVLCRKCHRTLHHRAFEEILAKANYKPMPHLRELPLEVDLNHTVLVLEKSRTLSEGKQ